MKIIDVPQTRKLGLTVTYPSRNGLIRRSWVVPANPRTADQRTARSRLSSAAAADDSLTEAQQDAWIAAAAQEQSKPTLGQSGPLTGLQLGAFACVLLTRAWRSLREGLTPSPGR